MSRKGNYKGTPEWQEKSETIKKLAKYANQLEDKIKLNALQLKYAKPHNKLPLCMEGFILHSQYAMTFTQMRVVQAQPLFPKGGIEVGNNRPEIHH